MLTIKNDWGSLTFFWDGQELKNIHAALVAWPDDSASWERVEQYSHTQVFNEQGFTSTVTTPAYRIIIPYHGHELWLPLDDRLCLSIKDVEVTLPERTVMVPEERKRLNNLEASAKELMGGNRRSAEFDGSIGGDGRTPRNSGMSGPDGFGHASWAG